MQLHQNIDTPWNGRRLIDAIFRQFISTFDAATYRLNNPVFCVTSASLIE